MTPRRDFGLEAVVAAITERSNGDGVLVSIPELAADTGMSDSAVKRALLRAVESHQVAVEHRGANKVNRYRLVNGARDAPPPKLLRRSLGERDAPLKRAPRERDAPPRNAPAKREPGRDAPARDARALRPPDLSPLTRATGLPLDAESAWFGALEAAQQPLASVVSDAVDAPPARPRARARARAKAAPRERRSDPLFDAIAAAWLGEGAAVGKSAGGLIGMAASEIRRDYQGEASDVPARWAELCSRYDEPTPAALAKHWPTLDRQQRRAAQSRSATGVEAAKRRAEEARHR